MANSGTPDPRVATGYASPSDWNQHERKALRFVIYFELRMLPVAH